MQYAILDIARVGYELERLKPLASLWLLLYRGPQDAQQEETAPCLAGYEPGDAFANWFTQAGQVGVGIETDVSAEELRKHLRRFLLVELEGSADTTNRKVYFRYYDPSVLRVFLPTCDKVQLAEFFGPIRAFIAPDSDQTQGLRFTLQEGQLQTQPLALQTKAPTL